AVPRLRPLDQGQGRPDGGVDAAHRTEGRRRARPPGGPHPQPPGGVVNIISRKSWGARAPRSRSTVSWSQRREFIVHYSYGPTTQSVRSIQDFHMDSNRWSDIGYNFLVDTAGRIYEGRGWLVQGSHAPGHNTSGIGVCMIGRDGDSTAAAKKAIRWLYDEAVRLAGRNLAKLGHRDVYATSCPGNELYAWVRAGMPADTEEDDMPSPKDLWEWDGIPAPRTASTYDKNPTWKAASHLTDINERVRDLQQTAAAGQAAIGELSRAVAELAADRGQAVDADALVARITEQIERVTVRLDVQAGDGE